MPPVHRRLHINLDTTHVRERFELNKVNRQLEDLYDRVQEGSFVNGSRCD